MSEEEKVALETEETVDDAAEEFAEAEETEETDKTEPGTKTEEEIEEQQTDETTETHGEDSNDNASGKADEIQDKYLRLMAEYQNYRNRTAKEKSDIYAHANEKMALDILEVIDNFERAMEQKPQNDKFADGMELILKQLQKVLEKNNISEIEAEGKPFDPNMHNAVTTEPCGEGVESGTVTKVFQKGYVLNNKVIRAAMVAVAQE